MATLRVAGNWARQPVRNQTKIFVAFSSEQQTHAVLKDFWSFIHEVNSKNDMSKFHFEYLILLNCHFGLNIAVWHALTIIMLSKDRFPVLRSSSRVWPHCRLRNISSSRRTGPGRSELEGSRGWRCEGGRMIRYEAERKEREMGWNDTSSLCVKETLCVGWHTYHHKLFMPNRGWLKEVFCTV